VLQIVAICCYIFATEKMPKESAPKNKKISVTKISFFFQPRDANFSLWSQTFDFPKVF
jgi:hypothetical protein